MSDELLRLADRCEAAAGGDLDLDETISRTLLLTFSWSHHVLRYTSSVDAALALVPDGAGLEITRYWIGSRDGPVWSAEISTGGVPDNPRRVYDCYDASTTALAITAAALRARASRLRKEVE